MLLNIVLGGNIAKQEYHGYDEYHGEVVALGSMDHLTPLPMKDEPVRLQ